MSHTSVKPVEVAGAILGTPNILPYKPHFTGLLPGIIKVFNKLLSLLKPFYHPDNGRKPFSAGPATGWPVALQRPATDDPVALVSSAGPATDSLWRCSAQRWSSDARL